MYVPKVMKPTPSHMWNFNRWLSANLFINAVMMMMDPLIICHNEAVIYNCAISNSKVQSRSQTDGMIRMMNVLYETLSFFSGAVKYC